MRFEWDEAKNAANQRRHGVSFEEARSLFEGGDEYLEIFDVAHSEDEDRLIAIGPIQRGDVVVVGLNVSRKSFESSALEWRRAEKSSCFKHESNKSDERNPRVD